MMLFKNMDICKHQQDGRILLCINLADLKSAKFNLISDSKDKD